MNIIGIDPGDPVHWACISFSGTPALVEKGSWTHAEALAWRAPESSPVAIERPFGLYLELAGAALFGVTAGVLAAAWIGGRIAGALERDGVRVLEVPCPDARRFVGVRIGGAVKKGEKREKVDKQTARILPGKILGWPKKSNRGARDAAIAALYGAHLMGLI